MKTNYVKILTRLQFFLNFFEFEFECNIKDIEYTM